MADEVTNAELARRLSEYQREMREDIHELRGAFNSYVLEKVYQAERLADNARFEKLDSEVRAAKEYRQNQVKFIVGAIIVPVTLAIVSIALNLAGAL